jgi:hypothetical protein
MLRSMSDQKSDDERRRDKLLLRLLKTPPKSRAALAEELRRAKAEARKDRVIMGELPPPGYRWQILGSWPPSDKMDILPETDQEVSQPPSAAEPRPTPKQRVRRSAGKERRVLQNRSSRSPS